MRTVRERVRLHEVELVYFPRMAFNGIRRHTRMRLTRKRQVRGIRAFLRLITTSSKPGSQRLHKP